MMANKIIFFIGSMHGGGAERVISILANHYCQIGWNVEIALLLDKNIGYNLDSKIKVVDLSLTGSSYFKRLPGWVKKIRHYVKDSKPSIIVSFIGRINVLVLTACLGLNVPIIVSERNDPKHDGRSNLMLKVCNLSYRMAQTVVYQTRYEQSCFSPKLKNGVVIVNPVSVNIDPCKVQLPNEIVTAGRLTPQKNQEMLVNAVSMINEQSVALKIYGDGQLKKKLQHQAKILNVDATFCGNVANLHECINGSGIFVLCSNFEGLSNALIEAMMLGLVCVSTNYPGAEEIISDGVNGLLVPCGNSEILAKKITMVLKNDCLREKLSMGALTSGQKYREDEVLKKWDKLIEETIK